MKVIDCPTAIVDSWTASKLGGAGAAGGAESPQPGDAAAAQVAAAKLNHNRFVDCFHMSCPPVVPEPPILKSWSPLRGDFSPATKNILVDCNEDHFKQRFLARALRARVTFAAWLGSRPD
jgi:hypothetical protein